MLLLPKNRSSISPASANPLSFKVGSSIVNATLSAFSYSLNSTNKIASLSVDNGVIRASGYLLLISFNLISLLSYIPYIEMCGIVNNCFK